MENDKKSRIIPIYKIPKSKYPEIWNTLNNWEWHPALGDKPENWDCTSKSPKEMRDYKHKIIQPLMDFMEASVGIKAMLRYAHVVLDKDESDQMFDDWWDSTQSIPNKLNNFWELRDDVSSNSNHKRVDNLKTVLMILISAILSFLLGFFLT